MDRKVYSHKVNALNEAIDIYALGPQSLGGAFCTYGLTLVKGRPEDPDEARPTLQTRIEFQDGPIPEVGFNGFTDEALLAIVEHRLMGFQSGRFACDENAMALEKLRECQAWLKERTKNRQAAGVEGTHTK